MFWSSVIRPSYVTGDTSLKPVNRTVEIEATLYVLVEIIPELVIPMLEIVITMHNPDFTPSIYGESAVLRDLSIHATDITTANIYRYTKLLQFLPFDSLV